MKITIFGEKFSDNLGDGVIADCLNYVFSLEKYKSTVETLDLSMRDNYSIGTAERHDNKVDVLSVFLRRIKKLVGWEFFRFQKFKRKYEDKIKDSDLVLIGGGQIFLDNELNFPVKVRALVKLLDKNLIRRAFICCGVSNKFSKIGSKIFKKSLESSLNLALIVRDLKSVQSAKSKLNYPNPLFLIDPAIISSDVYNCKKIFPEFSGKTIGLNIMDFGTLEKTFLHQFGKDFFLQLWLDVISDLLGKNFRIVLHTNGAAEDNYCLNLIVSRLNNADGVLISIPNNPAELANIIFSVDSLIAYRLHANILAYSLGVPSIGFVWDDKVSEFAAVTEREQFFFSNNQLNKSKINEALSNSLNQPVDITKLRSLKKSFYEGIDSFFENNNLR